MAMGACGLPPRARKASRGAGFESKMASGSSANACLRADTWHASGLLLGGLGLLLEVAQGARTCHQNAPRKRAQKARPKFSGAERAPRKAKGSRGGTYFFWDNFWDDFWDLFWAVLRGEGPGQPRSAARGWSLQGLHAAPGALAASLRCPRRKASARLSRVPRERVTRLWRPGRDLVGQPVIEAPILVGKVARTPRGPRGREVREQMHGRPCAKRHPSRSQYPLGVLKQRLEGVGSSGQWGPWARRSYRSNIVVTKTGVWQMDFWA